MHFVWLDAVTMSVNNQVNIFLSKILLASIGLNSTEIKFATPFNPVFIILLTIKFCEILPKHSA